MTTIQPYWSDPKKHMTDDTKKKKMTKITSKNKTILAMFFYEGLLVIVPIPPSPVNFRSSLSVSKTLQTLQLQIWKSKSLNLNSEYIWHWLACSKWKFEFTFSYSSGPCDRCWRKCGAMQVFHTYPSLFKHQHLSFTLVCAQNRWCRKVIPLCLKCVLQ